MAQPPKFEVRTMASDIASTQGGEQPKPYTPPTTSPKIPPMGGMPPLDMATLPANEIKEESFELPQIKETTGEKMTEQKQETKQPEMPAKEAEAKPASSMSQKGLFISILSAIVVIGIVAVIYFFVWPKFFGGAMEETAQAPITETTPTPTAEPTPEPAPIVENQPAEQEITAPTEEKYVSILKISADETTDSKLTEVSLTAIKSLAQFTTASTPSLKEYSLKNSEGKLVSVSQFLSLFLPGVFTEELSANFEKGGMFSYTDDKGTWLGIVAQLKDGVALADTQNKVSALETNTELANFFLTDAGATTTWKSGQAESVNTRYLAYSLAGAGLNYGWMENKLIITGSYTGFKEIAKRLK